MKCHDCGQEYDGIAVHWSRSDCSHPELTEKQKDIAVGLLLSDGNVRKRGRMAHPTLRTQMITEPFVRWVDKEFGEISRAVTQVEEDERHDTFRWATKPHPWFETLLRWYDTGEKRFPEDLNINPLRAKVWYCGDGSLQGGYSARFYSKNESDRLDVLASWFRDIGFEVSERQFFIEFDVENTKLLLDWMGEPLPGFDYKWGIDV